MWSMAEERGKEEYHRETLDYMMWRTQKRRVFSNLLLVPECRSRTAYCALFCESIPSFYDPSSLAKGRLILYLAGSTSNQTKDKRHCQMAMSDVIDLGDLVIENAHKVEELGEKLYKSSEEWDLNFPQKVNTLERKLKFWEAQSLELGMTMLFDKVLTETLLTLKSMLEKEVSKLKQQELNPGWVKGCFPTFKTTVFPEKLGLSIQNAIQAFDDNLENLRHEDKSLSVVERRLTRMPMSLQIRNDNRYVSLELSEGKLLEALEKPQVDGEGPTVVLLHGGPGYGKSTLARHVLGLHYRKPENKSIFDIVRLLECGARANTPAKELELLQLLGSDINPLEDQDRQQQDPEDRIRARLSGILRTEKILLILDNVSDTHMLRKIVDLCGHGVKCGVKCVVTSQDATLCDNLNIATLVKIQMEHVQQEDARLILASHARLEDSDVPDDLLETVDKVIKETEANPLALACVAAVMNLKRSSEIVTWDWEVASKDLLTVLDTDSTKLILGKKYPRSLFSSMRFTMENLPAQAETLLLLTSMCKDLAVPEEVIEILYLCPGMQNDANTFSKFRNELETLDLLKVTHTRISLSGKDSPIYKRDWALHFVQKNFISQECAKKMESILVTLVNNGQHFMADAMEKEIVNEEQMQLSMVATVCAMYFNDSRAHTAALKMHIPSKNLSKLRIHAIEPILTLVGRPLSDKWRDISRASARQVVLKYICNDMVDDAGMAHLLSIPAVTLITLMALDNLCLVQRTPFMDARMPGSMKVLVTFLKNGVDSSIQVPATSTLGTIAWDSNISTFPGVLEGLTRLLESTSHSTVQGNCMRALAGLASRDSAVISMIVKESKVLEIMAEALFVDINPTLQVQAATALAILASGPAKDPVQVLNAPGVLAGLVKALSRNDLLPLQTQAMNAFLFLVGLAGKSKVKIVEEPGALPAIWKLSTGSGTSDLPIVAGKVLSRLALAQETRDSVKALDPDLTKSLETLLSDDTLQDTHRAAAITLTCVDPARQNKASLDSFEGLLGRAEANCVLGSYNEALVDLDRAEQLQSWNPETFGVRCNVKGKLNDLEGALSDADVPFLVDRKIRSVRGFLKGQQGDLEGALSDFNSALEEADTYLAHLEEYEIFKHRGYVKFLMQDEDGARADAEAALKSEPARIDEPGYGSFFLDESPVEFLGYKLR